jgi:uncharacterized membrane protein YgcG
MKHRIIPIVLALVAPLLFSARVHAAKAEVVDNAGFFSPDAVTKANQQLSDLDDKYARQMRVETYASIPDDLRSQYSPERKAEFFQSWARRQAEKAGISGVMVLVCRNPSTLQVEIGRDTERAGVFTQADRKKMTDLLATAFRAKNFDQGLTQTIDYFRARLEAHQNAGDAKQAPPPAAAQTPRLANQAVRRSGRSSACRACSEMCSSGIPWARTGPTML